MMIRGKSFTRCVSRAAVCAVVLLAMAATAAATTLVRMSVAKMSLTAQAIVRARCLDSSARWDSGEIWTFTSFSVEEVWSGAVPARITVRLLGGRVANLTSTVSGIPRFRRGEDVVLFLERMPTSDFSIVSWQQGTFRIRRDPASGQESVEQDTASFATFDSATRRFEAVGIRRMTLGAFRAQVDAALLDETGRKR